MTTKEIIEKYLKDNGFDGLVNVDAECGCGLDDFLPCSGDGGLADCEPAYLVKCDCPEHDGSHFSLKKKEFHKYVEVQE